MSYRLKIGLAIFFIIAAGVFLTLNPRAIFKRQYFSHPLISDLVFSLQKTRKSFLNLTDILYLPYWFRESKLEVFHLTVAPNDLYQMNQALPDNPFDGRLTEEHQLLVKGHFKAKDYDGDVRVRYRGFVSNHWNREQRSYQIRFPGDKLFRGLSRLDLIIPSDRQYVVESFDNYRVKKLGLNVQDISFVRLAFNSRDDGVYLAQERLNKEWLEVEGDYLDDAPIFGLKLVGEPSRDPSDLTLTGFTSRGRKSWQELTGKGKDGQAFEPLEFLVSLLENGSDAELERYLPDIFDLQNLYAAVTLNTLAGNSHSLVSPNPQLIFDTVSGKFQFILSDMGIGFPGGCDDSLCTAGLTDRVLMVPKFFEEFKDYFNSYVENDQNLKDDLAHFDKLQASLKAEFYKDRNKWDSSLKFSRSLLRYREQLIAYFNNQARGGALARADRYQPGEPYPKGQGGIAFKDSFKNFPAITKSIDRFVAENPQFVKIDPATVALKVGPHSFPATVIVPKGLTLIIEPGADLHLGNKVSIVSYSPVMARGTKDKPITFGKLGLANWGVVAVINSDRRSVFDGVKFNGGSSSAGINGIVFSGMLSVRNGDVIIKNSTFSGDGDDDAVHIARATAIIDNNFFTQNNGDALDLDFVRASVVSNNVFIDNGLGLEKKGEVNGDAIDLSFGSVSVLGNVVYRCGDKGISIGERTVAKVVANTILKCGIGIAVKDQAQAIIQANTVIASDVGLSLYRKKPEFVDGGWAAVISSIFWDNKEQIRSDELSSVVIKDTVVEGGYRGENVGTEKPNFSKLLPAYILNLYGKGI